MVFDTILLDRQRSQKLQCLYGNQMAKNFFLNNDFAQLMNRNLTILGSRLYSPNLKDVAGLEDAHYS